MPAMTRKSPYAFLPTLARQGRGGTVQRVQDVIRDAVVRLELPPGAIIDKAALCARLGVSRFPVSEALGRLAAEGFVEVLPQRGTRVARIDLADCRQAMFIRRALETEAARAIAPRADAALLSALEKNLGAQERALGTDYSTRFHQLDMEMHELLLGFLGYERVRHAVEAARGSLDRARLFMCTPQRQLSTFGEHKAIVAALKKRDAEAAGDAMAGHLDAVMTELVGFAERNPDAVTLPARDTAAA
ncbi:MAG: GntR family transcriptional regulator [Alphaproteobacteria bacterium]|nr:MAG: GntR family transcriptional regulator [Alphaproteobacteria bacterium]